MVHLLGLLIANFVLRIDLNRQTKAKQDEPAFKQLLTSILDADKKRINNGDRSRRGEISKLMGLGWPNA